MLIILVGIQFIRIDKTLPTSTPGADFLENHPTSEAQMAQIKSACYDCHSNETTYPWYTNIAPASWWIQGHINGGRQNLNFSEWMTYDAEKQSHKLEEIIEEIKHEHMPIGSYTWLHGDAKLTQEDREALVIFFDSVE